MRPPHLHIVFIKQVTYYYLQCQLHLGVRHLEETPKIKRRVLVWNFERTQVPRSCFVGMAWNFFHPKRNQQQQINWFSRVIYYVLAQYYPKRQAEHPKRYDGQPHPFYTRVPPEGGTPLILSSVPYLYLHFDQNILYQHRVVKTSWLTLLSWPVTSSHFFHDVPTLFTNSTKQSCLIYRRRLDKYSFMLDECTCT